MTAGVREFRTQKPHFILYRHKMTKPPHRTITYAEVKVYNTFYKNILALSSEIWQTLPTLKRNHVKCNIDKYSTVMTC